MDSDKDSEKAITPPRKLIKAGRAASYNVNDGDEKLNNGANNRNRNRQ